MKMSWLEPEGRCLGWGGHPSQVALPATVTSPPMPTAPHARNTFGPGHTSPSLAHLFFANWFLCWQFRQTLKLKRLIYPWIPKDLNTNTLFTTFWAKKRTLEPRENIEHREHFCQTNASPAKLGDALDCILLNWMRRNTLLVSFIWASNHTSDKDLITFERTNLHFFSQQITVCCIFMTLE